MTSSQVPAVGFLARCSTNFCALSVSIMLGRGPYFSFSPLAFSSPALLPLSGITCLSDLKSAAYARLIRLPPEEAVCVCAACLPCFLLICGGTVGGPNVSRCGSWFSYRCVS